jgi:hypothetical protein
MSTALRLLILEDSPYDAELAVAMLEEGGYVCQWERVDTRDAFVARVHAGEYDLILADYSLPAFDGFTALRLLLESSHNVPFVFFSGALGEETVIDALKAGATDYVMKGRLERLMPVVRRALQEKAEQLQRRHAEEALRASNHTLHVMIQDSPLAIIALDLTGQVQIWNPAAERMLGWREAEVLGHPLPCVPPEQQDAYASLCHRALQGESFAGVEVRWQRCTGEALDLSVSMAPLSAMSPSIMVVLADITERERTAEMKQQQLEARLFQAQKMESIGTLAGGIAHDFNNLLTAIFGNVQLVRARLHPDDPLQAYMASIESAADRAASLTRQLLVFSHRQPLERKTINLNETVSNFTKMLRRIIGEDIAVRLHLTSQIPSVLADPVQIDQVVMNLAVNARDAMPSGGQLLIETDSVRLDAIDCHQYPWVQPGQYVQLIVSDTGCGIDADTLQHIFEPFFTTKEVGKGTGLGLSVVYGIVKAHAGFIQVDSEVGHGTSVKVYLPAALQPAEALPGTSAPELSSGKETLLIAEDEESLRELTYIALTELGYTVLLAQDGQEAVARFVTHGTQIDLVILDVVMPHMSGLEVYKRIRAMGSRVPVLFMTGYSPEIAQVVLAAEPDIMLLQKPYSMHELGQKVRQALEQARR